MKKFYKVRRWDRVELEHYKTLGVYEVNMVYYSKNSIYLTSQIIHLHSITGSNNKIVGHFFGSPEITKIF